MLEKSALSAQSENMLGFDWIALGSPPRDTVVEKTAHQWFEEAAKCYVEFHQGCPWCGGSHRVFHSERGGETQYYCMQCDFRAGYDRESDNYFTVPGEKMAADGLAKTMFMT